MASIFTRIIQGEIPAHVVYESEDVIAFLDAQPRSVGHTLVCPKREVPLMEDMGEEELCAWMLAVQTTTRAVLKATKASGYNLRLNNGSAAGQEIAHAHMHIIPRESRQRLPTHGSAQSPEALEEMARKIRSHL